MAKWSAEETDHPLLAEDRNFYTVENEIKDGRENRSPTCSVNGICRMADC